MERSLYRSTTSHRPSGSWRSAARSLRKAPARLPWQQHYEAMRLAEKRYASYPVVASIWLRWRRFFRTKGQRQGKPKPAPEPESKRRAKRKKEAMTKTARRSGRAPVQLPLPLPLHSDCRTHFGRLHASSSFFLQKFPNLIGARFCIGLTDFDQASQVVGLKHEHGQNVGTLGFLGAESTRHELEGGGQARFVGCGQAAQVA